MSEKLTFQNITEKIISLLKKDEEPEENSVEGKFLILNKEWYSRSTEFFKHLTFKKIRRAYYGKCNGIESNRISELRLGMIAVNKEYQEYLRRIREREKRLREANERVMWEIRHDADQAADILPEVYLKKILFR